jgi:catalase
MIQECYRHSKALGAWGNGRLALEAAGCVSGPGIVVEDEPSAVLATMTKLLGAHRVWERFPVTVS